MDMECNPSLMEDLLLKLCILGYKKSFCNHELKPMHSAYFLVKEPNQFQYFSSLCCWLFLQYDNDFLEWSEFDAPDTICKNIIRESLNVTKENKQKIQSLRLRSGYGKDILILLNLLTDAIIKMNNISINIPKYPKNETENLSDEEIEDEIIEEDDILEDFGSDGENDEGEDEKEERKKSIGETENEMSYKEWYLEVEKLGPRLRSQRFEIETEWRTHFQKSKCHSKNLTENVDDLVQKLLKKHRKITKELKRIEKKETSINNQYSSLKDEYSGSHKKKEILEEEFEIKNNEVNDLTQELAKITDLLSDTKNQTEKQNASMTDVTPLQNIRQTIKKITRGNRRYEFTYSRSATSVDES